MPYREYLKTRHWWRTRIAALDYYDSCVLCGSNVGLEVHHRDEEAYSHRGKERLCDLSVLCADCHGSYHRRAS
jgi:hypothetical protein